MAAWHTMLDTVRSTIEAVSGLTEAPGLDAETLPNSLRRPGSRMGFAIDLQSAPAQAPDRQQKVMRTTHIVTVSVAALVRQHGQWSATYGSLLDAELDVVGAMLEIDSLAGYSVTWEGTAREHDRAFLRSDLVFALTHSHSTGAN